MGYLEVLRPPEIDDALSSGDVVATEGERAVLKCVAKGHPKPSVTWVREDKATIMVSDGSITKPGQEQFLSSLVSVLTKAVTHMYCTS